MLEDRDYMRDPSARTSWSLTATLCVVLVGVFVLQSANEGIIHSPIERWLVLTPECFSRGFVWQLITFQFLHAGILHLAFNLIALWFFGRPVENVLGRSRYLVALLGTGVVGGILQALLMLGFPDRYGNAALGASAGISGILAIFCLLDPSAEIRLYFVIPVRAIMFLWIWGIYSFCCTLNPSWGGGTADAAHLGGILAGIAWVKLGWHHDYIRLPWEGLFSHWRQWEPLQGRRRKRELVRAASVKVSKFGPATAESPPDLPSEEFISREVDPILDKISAHGIQSLTERERKILEAARKRMGKR